MVNPRAAKTYLLVGLLIASILPAQMVAAEGMEPNYDPNTDLVARRTSTAPIIDGVVDVIWDDALALATFATGNSGNFDVNLKAMYDNDYIYFLASWNEFGGGQPDKDREVWELTSNTTPGTWDHKEWGTDRISFLFQDPDIPVEGFNAQGCDAVCHDLVDMHTNTTEEMLDVWVWSASTTNAQGYADDGVLLNNNTVTQDPKRMHVLVSDLDWDSGNDGWIVNNDTSVGGTRPTHVWDPSATPMDSSYMYDTDAVEVNWGTFDITTLPLGTMVPGHVLKTPSGDRANIQAKGVHNGSGWNVEFKRLRDTGSSDDAIFDEVNTPYYFSPALTNNMTGEDHAKGITAYKLWLAEPDMPDLTIQRINPIGTQFIVNSTIEFGVFIDNIGWADAAASSMEYGLQGVGTPEVAAVTTIGWGKTQYIAVEVNTTGLTPGTYTFEVTVDSAGDLTEINESNNMGTFSIELGAEPLPNLFIEEITVTPETPTEGGFAQIAVKVGNDGTSASEIADVLVYLDNPLDPIGSGTVMALNPLTSDTYGLTWGPITTPAGDYILNVVVDPDGDQKELDEGDNNASLAFTIEGPTLPDLFIEAIVPLSASVTQGTETSTQVVVGNQGGDTVTTNFEVALFLDEAFTVGDKGLLYAEVITEDILVGSNVTVILSWTVKDEFTVGPHFLRAEADWMGAVDELEEGNNNGTYDDLLVLRRKLPDLVVESVAPAAPSPKLETLLTMTVTVRNRGNLSSSSTTLTVQDVDNNITLTVITVPALNISNSTDLIFEWLVTGVQVGDLMLQFQVDALDFIREESEFNNALSVNLVIQPADLADLRIAENGVTFSPAEPRVGDAVTISIKVENVGTKSSENTTLEVWLGNNPISTQDLLILGVGESRTMDVFWPASNILSPNDYNLLVKVDPGNDVKELNDANNEMSATVTFVLPPMPELEGLVVTASKEKVKSGTEITITVSIENTGDAPDLVTFVVKDGETEVASEQVTVAAGGNKSETFSFKLKGTGDHTITVSVYKGTDIVLDPLGEELVSDLTVKVTKKPDDNPGFGTLLVALAIIGAVVLLTGQRRRK
jgi:subtilase family serine protease